MAEEEDNSATETLCKHVRIAKELLVEPRGSQVIEGEEIRCLALSLPLPGKTEACTLTPFGIRIVGAKIDGDILLDRAVPPGGGALCPIEFERCDFIGRFSGVHARFSRLGFRDCTFQNAAKRAAAADAAVDPASCDTNGPNPTIDLTGATLDADLHLVQLSPAGIPRERVPPRSEGNHLWIRLIGARIDGELDLCDCHLRAPPPQPHLMSENAEDALDLTLAEIRGDLQLVGCCRIEGRIKMRAAHIRGDAWMSGAEIENPGEQALFMQGTRIEGLAMLDGRFVGRNNQGPFRRFKCIGELNLSGAEIGRRLYVTDAVVRGSFRATNLTVHDNVVLDGEFSGPIDLAVSKIGGSLIIAGLNLGAPAGRLSLGDGTIGRSLKVASPELHYKLRRARSVPLACFPGVELVETLWKLKPGAPTVDDEDIPDDRRWIQAAFLVGPRWPLRHRILHVDGHADVLRRAAGHFERKLNGRTVVEYAKLHCFYVHSREGRVRLVGRATTPVRHPRSGRTRETYSFTAEGVRDDLRRRWKLQVSVGGDVVASPAPKGVRIVRLEKEPRLRNGLVVTPPLTRGEKVAAEEDWIAPAALLDMKEDVHWRRFEDRFARHLNWNPLLQARIDLEGLTCDMLDDNAGKAWGLHPDQIKINHFVYRRAAWGMEKAGRKSSLQLWGGGVLHHLALWARGLAHQFARMVSRSRPDGMVGRVGEPSEHLEPWEARRNWIYRQFPPGRGIIPGSRRLRKFDYRPQPFEQVILAARAEGREAEALKFEVMRSRIEWRIFNQDIRWTLAPFAVTVGALWLMRQGDKWSFTLTALVATLILMAVLSFVDSELRRRIPHPTARGTVRNVLIWLPAALLLFADGWWWQPFHFIVAFMIYCSIRFAAVFSNVIMRFGTGYLRKPINAFIMVIAAFLVGWAGVHSANRRHMIVVEAQPVAGMAGPDKHVRWPQKPAPPFDPDGPAIVVGSTKAADEAVFREIPCSPGLSEPLYALDVLIPLVDLHEESRCAIRRLPVPPEERAGAESPHTASAAAPAPVGSMSLWELATVVPERALESHRFWWWMKALYAIAGWFLVSLALLTFAQVNRTRGEFAEG